MDNKVLTAPRKPTLIPNLEVYQKLQKLRRLSDAIVAIDALDKQTPQTIQQRQNLVLQRKALQVTMPPIRLVSSNIKKPMFQGLKPINREPDDCA